MSIQEKDDILDILRGGEPLKDIDNAMNEIAKDETDVVEIEDSTKKEETTDSLGKSPIRNDNVDVTNPRVTIDSPASIPTTGDKNWNIALPNTTGSELNNTQNKRVFSMLTNEEQPENEHEALCYRMLGNLTRGDSFTNSLKRENSDWQQSIEIQGRTFKPARPKFAEPEKGEELTGEKALLALDNVYGLGGHIIIPLVHSGIWVKLRPCSELEYITLSERMANDKKEFGRETLGMTFSNTKVYTVAHLVDFILDHVTDTSLIDWDEYKLRDLIKVTDLPILAAGMAYTLYPQGFDYVSPCTATDNCNHIYQAKLKIPNCMVFDRAAFTNTQKEFMADRNAKRSLEDIKTYQLENEPKNNFHKTENGLTIYFKIPSIQEHIESGNKWVTEVEQMVDEAFTDTISQSTRRDYIQSRVGLTLLRQYAHFFKRITLPNETYIDNRKDLDNAINKLSNINMVINGVITKIGEFIDDETKAIVAIPRYACPECRKTIPDDIEKHPYLIPLEPVSLFFTLGDQRIQYGSLI